MPMRPVIIPVTSYDLKDTLETTVKDNCKNSIKFFEKGLSKPLRT